MQEEFVSHITYTKEHKRVLTLKDCDASHVQDFQGFLHLTYNFTDTGQQINLCMTHEEVSWLYDQFGKALGVS